MAIKISITDLDGEVFDILTEMTDGSFTDTNGETVAGDMHELKRIILPELIEDAKSWSLKKVQA